VRDLDSVQNIDTGHSIHASAPGKLFLLGEYAVLNGSPALLTAIDQRVLVTIRSSTTGHWVVHTPGLDTKHFELGPMGQLPDGFDAQQRSHLRVFDAVRGVVLDRAGSLPAALDVTVDSTAFFRTTDTLGTHKLGLGSSAAVAVALTAALMLAAGLPADRAGVLELALAAHRAAQGGTGSGGDVAASVFGGLIEYTRGQIPAQLPWPRLLDVMAVVTGTGSSTTNLVARVAEYEREYEAQHQADIGRLAALALQAKETLAVPHAFLRLLSDYFAALTELDEHAHAGIVTDYHLRLHTLVAGLGGVFKTSGAGGGDVGLVFSVGDESKDAITAALAAEGAEVVPLGFGAAGLEIRGTKDGTAP
jgi:phosphomevalonate kinase